MTTRSIAPFALSLLVAALGACSDQDGAPAASALQRVTACSYQFTADVRMGPSAPLHLAGTLDLVPRLDRYFEGRLVPASGAEVPVIGQLTPDGRSIMLQFTLSDGRVINGVGPLPSGTSMCRGPLAGELRGPADGDTGDWLTATQVTLDTCATACITRRRTRQECANYCTVANNFVTTGTAYTQCLDSCNAGGLDSLVIVCDARSGGGSITSFFGTCP